MADVFMTVWETAAEVAQGEPLQFTKATIAGANSAPIVGDSKRSRRVRIYAEAACWVKWGTAPVATGSSDSMPVGADNPEYLDLKAGDVLTAIARA